MTFVRRFFSQNLKDAALQLVGVVLSLWALPSLHIMLRVVRERQALKPDTYPQMTDLLSSVLWAVLFAAIQHFSGKVLTTLGYRIIPRTASWSLEVWAAKVERFSNSVYKLFVHLSFSLVLFFVLQDQPWLPPVMGGHGSTVYCWTNGFPFQPPVPALTKTYQAVIGYLMCECATHMIRERDRPDFTELMLHNSLVLLLTVCSYLGNYVRMGSLVMLSNFAPDVVVYTAKSLVDTPWSGGILIYIPLALSYFYGRLYIFIGYLFRSVWIEAPRMAPEEIQEYWSFLVTLLCVMLVMNTYWFVMILKIGLFILSTGQSRDIQANLSAIDLDSKKAVLSPRASASARHQQQPLSSSAKKSSKKSE
ncbi:hypothetical protein FOZ61_009555 [Perkinsus olseni]|uniref:TLC domain-containing protein n=1 Tax=Perkinsus olseni TaxID=32597 RepID=A0A7J6L0D0_PEROL|nr:hypothetical protein FOZ61_009555 [Perkinsus olseni]